MSYTAEIEATVREQGLTPQEAAELRAILTEVLTTTGGPAAPGPPLWRAAR